MKSKIQVMLAAFAAVGLAALFFHAVDEQPVYGQAAAISVGTTRSVGDYTFTSVTITPNNANNATYVWKANDLTGTNSISVNPTNANLVWTIGGTNATAVMATNLTIICTNSGAGTVFQRTLQFRNGMMTLCTTP